MGFIISDPVPPGDHKKEQPGAGDVPRRQGWRLRLRHPGQQHRPTPQHVLRLTTLRCPGAVQGRVTLLDPLTYYN